MNEYNLFAEECNLNFHPTDVEEFLAHDIANVFQAQNKQQCLTSGSIPTTLGNTSSSEINLDSLDFDFDKPNIELKTIDPKNKINETFSPKLSPSFQFQIPCFDNTPNSSTTNSSQFSGIENYEPVSQTSKESSRKRSSAQHGQDHIMAERKRRENLTQNFIALAALVPNLKKVQ